ncbi:carbohydrate ABC transporter permease [uncultured Robinsoniella sp.]|uniref:carbohydrate ABC transporter permease n=1 Tax=Robinsoniella sp. TaxID=2496533 RepID=UPI00374F75AC
MVKNKNKIKKSKGEITFNCINVIVMALILVITFYPFWYIVVISLSKTAAGGGFALWPEELSLNAYKVLLDYDAVWTGYVNTIVRCLLGTSISVVFTAMTAYPLSKRDLPFQNLFTNFILFTMLFSGGLIPTYLLVKNLNLFNSVWALVLPSMLGAYNIFIVRNFYRSIPASLEEAAIMDGANWFYIWYKIIIPLSKPILATITLWILVGHWNSWYDAMLYIQDNDKTVVQAILRKITLENNPSSVSAINTLMAKIQAGSVMPSSKMLEAAITVVTILPMLIAYPFLQRYFVKGIMVGSVKG